MRGAPLHAHSWVLDAFLRSLPVPVGHQQIQRSFNRPDDQRNRLHLPCSYAHWRFGPSAVPMAGIALMAVSWPARRPKRMQRDRSAGWVCPHANAVALRPDDVCAAVLPFAVSPSCRPSFCFACAILCHRMDLFFTVRIAWQFEKGFWSYLTCRSNWTLIHTNS